MRILLTSVLALLSGCALSSEMPPVTASSPNSAMVPGWQLRTSLPTTRRFQHHRRFRLELDSASHLSRVSVTTHPGRYFLWAQRPRLTFFFVYSRMERLRLPEVVSLVFRTQSPQDMATNRLTLSCDGHPRETGLVPRSLVEAKTFVNNHFLTFDIPTPTFAAFITCAELALDVGGVRVAFTREQREALHDLGSRLTPAASP